MDIRKQQPTGINTNEQSDVSAPIYKLYNIRYVMLFLFAMAELCNTAVYGTCNPIAKEVGKIYNQSADVVTLSATLYLFMHPVFTFPASYLILYRGSAASIKLGVILTLLGVASRCLVAQGFIYVLIGQTLSGIGRPFILNAQASVALEWFPAEQRTKIMTLLNFMVTFSGILGYIVPPIFFSGYNVTNDIAPYEEGSHKFMVLVVSQALFCASFLLPLLVVFKTRPIIPPGPLPSNAHQNVGFIKSITRMFKDVKFLLIFMSFTLFYGTYKGYGVALVYILLPFGYGKSEIAYLSCMPVLGGLVSSLLIPGIYKQWGRYKGLTIILELYCMIMFFAFISACFVQNFPLMMVIATIQGFFMLPAIPLLLEWGCEQIYPINDSFCIGVMFSGATMGSSFIAQIIVAVIHGDQADKMDSFNGICVICGLFTIGAISIMFVREVKHKLALKKSFLSQRDLQDDVFPHACPEGDPEEFGLFDNVQVEDADSDNKP